jgi:hypothetical protein
MTLHNQLSMTNEDFAAVMEDESRSREDRDRAVDEIARRTGKIVMKDPVEDIWLRDLRDKLPSVW